LLFPNDELLDLLAKYNAIPAAMTTRTASITIPAIQPPFPVVSCSLSQNSPDHPLWQRQASSLPLILQSPCLHLFVVPVHNAVNQKVN